MARADTLPTARAGGQIRMASGINVLLGIWLIIAAFTIAQSQEAYWNDLLVGVIVLILALTRLSRPTEGTKPASWVNAAIGIWLIAAPFILSYDYDQEMWNDVIVGALVLIFAAWSAVLPRARDDAHATDTPGTTTAANATRHGTVRRGATGTTAPPTRRR